MSKKLIENRAAAPIAVPKPVVVAKAAPLPKPLKKSDEFSVGKARALRERVSRSMPTTGGTAAASTLAPMRVGAFGAVSNLSSTVATTSASAVQAAYASGGAKAAAIALEIEVKSHPNEATEILRAAQPTIAKIAQDIGRDKGNDDNVQTLVSLSAAASSAGAAGTELIATELAATIPNGDLERIDDGLTQAIVAGGEPDLALKIAELMKATKPGGAEDVVDAVVEGIDKLREDYTHAADDYAALEARLAGDLASLGPSMTPDERQKYMDAFWATPERAAAKEKVEDLADRLSLALESSGPALEAAALAGHEGAGEALIDAYEQLGRSPEHAAEAITWVGHVGSSPDLFKKLDDFGHDDLKTRFKEKLLTNAIPLAQQQILAAHVDDPASTAAQNALREFEALLGPVANAEALGEVATEVKAALEQTRAFVNGDFSSAQQLADAFDDASPFTQALGVAAITQGVFGQPEGSDGLATLGRVIGGTGTGLKLASRLLNTFAGAAKFSSNFGSFAAKIAPGLALIANVIQLKGDIDNLRDDPNAGEFIAAFGSLIGAAGGAVSYFFPPAGVVLGLAGTALHAIGDLVSNLITGNEKRNELLDDQAHLLEAATGLQFDAAREIARAQPRALARLAQLGVSPEQIRALALEDNVDLGSAESWVAIKAAALFGLEGAEVATVVDMLCGDGRFTYAENPLTWVFTTMENVGSEAARALWDDENFGPMQVQILDILRRENPEAAAYLEAHRGTPDIDVYGPFSYTQFE